MITEQLGPRVATTSPKPTRRRLRRKRRCEIGSLIIEPATRSGIREPARITIQENMLLATGKAQRFPIHAAIAAASPAETAADLAASPHGGTVMDVGARRYRSAATPRTNSLRRRCNSPSVAAAVVCRNHDMRLRRRSSGRPKSVLTVEAHRKSGTCPCPQRAFR